MTISLSLKVATPDCGFQKRIGKITTALECVIPPLLPKPPDLHCFVAVLFDIGTCRDMWKICKVN